MSLENTFYLKILDLDPEELKTILAIAVNLLYADGFAEIEEWNIITLIPALLDVIKAGTPKELKKKWEKKLTIASKALENEGGEIDLSHTTIKKKIKTPGARKSCLILLFIIASCDRKIHKKELKFIIEKIAGPWKFSKDDLIMVVKSAGNDIRDAQTLIRLIQEYGKE